MKKIAALFAFLAFAAASAQANPVLDQSSNGATAPRDANGFSYIGMGTRYASKFVADKTSIDGAGVYFSDPSKGGYWIDPDAVFTISLVDASAAVLASSSFSHAAGGWQDVFFNDVLTTIGSSYYVFASADRDYAAVTTYQYHSGTSANPGVYWASAPVYLSNANYTIDARIYSNGAAAVPEPGSILLLAIGALGLAGVSKRRKIHAPR
jgi:hypothetical protein